MREKGEGTLVAIPNAVSHIGDGGLLHIEAQMALDFSNIHEDTEMMTLAVHVEHSIGFSSHVFKLIILWSKSKLSGVYLSDSGCEHSLRFASRRYGKTTHSFNVRKYMVGI